jgi:hypothetical protein
MDFPLAGMLAATNTTAASASDLASATAAIMPPIL